MILRLERFDSHNRNRVTFRKRTLHRAGKLDPQGGHARKCVLPCRLRSALSTYSSWKLALCLRPQPARPGLAAWQWQWTGAKDVSLNTKPFSTWVPFTATRLATIELGFGRNSFSVILNWFFVSQVAGEFWGLQMRRCELSVAPALARLLLWASVFPPLSGRIWAW